MVSVGLRKPLDTTGAQVRIHSKTAGNQVDEFQYLWGFQKQSAIMRATLHYLSFYCSCYSASGMQGKQLLN